MGSGGRGMNPDGGLRLGHRERPGLRRREEGLEPAAMSRLTLRFRDRDLESAFRAQFFRHTLGNIRFTFLGGAVLWALWGVVLYPHVLALADRRFDVLMRYGVFIPLLLLGLALSFTRIFERIWEWAATAIALATVLIWVYYVAQILTVPAEYGYVGLILITAFTYTVLRLRFLFVVLITAVGIAAYLPYAVSAVYIFGVKTALASLFLLTFGALGGVAAYRMERFTRLLYVRERQLDRERERSDQLLRNVLPGAIADRLKDAHDGARVAEGLDEVTVMFADASGFTRQSAKTSPDALVGALDELFRRFDRVADRYGLEKIKTVGDAYMAVAGAPTAMADHAAAAAEMALDILEEAGRVRWPSGDPVVMRIGMASGPVVAGVIGHRKFAYDLWGDTVNLASRLESQGTPGRIMVPEGLAQELSDRFEFGPPELVDLKGRGPTAVAFLLGRRSEPAGAETPESEALGRPPSGSLS